MSYCRKEITLLASEFIRVSSLGIIQTVSQEMLWDIFVMVPFNDEKWNN